MLQLVNTLRAWFWDETFWTPPNATFALYEREGYRHFSHIYYSLYTAGLLILLRLILDRLVYSPLGIWLGCKQTHALPAPKHNALLEKVFTRGGGKLLNDRKVLEKLVKQLEWSERQIQRWMRARTAQTKPTVLRKFSECAWRFSFYVSAFIYGVTILWDKPWTWDSVYCFLDYPHHRVSDAEWWYYNIEAGFYLSLLFTIFIDVKRRDFWMMFVHHCVTLILLSFSWACNLVRIGTLVIAIHDFADIPMEFSKMMGYAKRKLLADIALGVFALFWISSRLVVLPYRIIYYSTVVAPQMLPMFSAYYFFNSLLLVLQSLHCIWTYYIVRVAIHTLTNDNFRDVRSDDETEKEEEEEEVSNEEEEVQQIDEKKQN